MHKLDLHGEDRIGARVKLKNFVQGHYMAGTISKLEVVFGIGSGVLKDEVTKVVKSSKFIKEYKHAGVWNNNPGAYYIYLKKRG